MEVLSGTNRLSEGGIRTQVSSNWTHPLWDPNTIKNDIGILKLATTLAIDNLNRPIALNGASIGDAQDLTAVGWGLTRVSATNI